MAGIYVSGGTFSGSGDLTTDWMVEDPSAGGTFTAPEGTLTYVGKYGGAGAALNHCHYARGTFNHNNGTITVNPTKDGGTRYLSNTNGGVRDLYSLTLLSGSISASYANDVRYGTECTLDGNLTIDGTDSAANTPIFQPGSQTFDLVVVKDVSVKTGQFGGNYNYGTMTLGSMNIQSGGIFDAPGDNIHGTGGITTMNYTTGLYSVIFRNNGTMIHNSGTLILNTNTDAVYGGGGGTGGPWDVIATERGAGTYTYRVYNTPIIENDLTISGNVIYSNNLAGGMNHTVSGNVVIVSGASYANTGATANTQTFGSLVLNAGAGTTFIASPNGTVNITSRDSGGYGWRRNAAATFTPNNGTVKFTAAALDVYIVEDTFYNLTCDLPHASNNELRYSDIDGNGLRVNNDFLINDGAFKFDTATDDMTVSGTLLVSGGSTFGVTNTPTGDHTIGTLNILGTYNATTGTTLLHGTASPLDNDGTFTHNSGTVVYSGSAYTMVTGDAATTFYDVVSKTVSATDGLRINSPTAIGATILNSVKCEVGYMARFDSGNGNALTTLGDSTHQCTVYNSGTRWRISPSTNYTVDIYGGDELLPFIWKGTAPEWNITTARTDRPTSFKWCDFKTNSVDLVTPGTANYVVALDGTCEFAGFTATSPDILDINGEYASFSDTLDVNGALYNSAGASDKKALLVAAGEISLTSTNNPSHLSIIQDGGYLNLESGAEYNQIFIRGGGLSTIGGTRDFKSPIIVGGTTNFGGQYSCGNIIIANGGTMDSTAKPTITTGSFSNRGGLFASSSAVDGNGTDTLITLDSEIASDTTSTVEFWINPDATGWDMILGGTANNIGYWYYNNGIIVGHVGGTTNLGTGGGVIPLNKWSNVVITHDGGTATLYVNGKLIDTGAVATPPTQKYIGGDVDYDAERFDGRIGRVSVWSKALTGAEIRTMMFQDFATATTTTCVGWWQFDEGEGLTVADKSTSGNDGTLNSNFWATGGTWTAGKQLGADGSEMTGNLYIGNRGTAATVFASSYFTLNNRKLISGSKFASKSHEGTDFYYVATSGASDYMNYSALAGAPILTPNDLHILANSYFNFDTSANNNQCDEITNYAGSTVRIVKNADFYTQDFDNQGTWLRNATYDGIIHDDGSTPHEYEPIDIMDDQDSPFDAEDLID